MSRLGGCGAVLSQSDVRPAVDTNVGISTQLAFPISTLEAAKSADAPVKVLLLVCLDHAADPFRIHIAL
jgi:hypothetical protein